MMDRRTAILGVAAVTATTPAIAQSGKCGGPGEQTLAAAGTLILLARAEHGEDWLRQAMAAVTIQARPC